MIKLSLPACPAELTPQREQELIDRFKSSGVSVWCQTYIKESLLQMSYGKCAYSEVRLEDGKYSEIEHFRCKSKYPDLVVRWGNLLPSSKVCNGKKGELDVAVTPIVNPLIDEPRDHLYVEAYRFYPKTEVGRNTIGHVALNNRKEFANRRGEECQYLERAFLNWSRAMAGGHDDQHWVCEAKTKLSSCDERSACSAVIATCILYESEAYGLQKEILRERGYWDSDFDQIEAMLDRLALPKPKED